MWLNQSTGLELPGQNRWKNEQFRNNHSEACDGGRGGGRWLFPAAPPREMPGWRSSFTMIKTLGCAKHLAQVTGRCLGASLTALVSTCFIPGHFIPCSSPDPSITETCREGGAVPSAKKTSILIQREENRAWGWVWIAPAQHGHSSKTRKILGITICKSIAGKTPGITNN